MSDKAVLCTGAGGFIGRYILSHYLDNEECDLYCLENGRFCQRLEEYLDRTVSDGDQRARVKVFSGDIGEPGLGLDDNVAAELKERITHVIHLAAIYNLSVPRDVSMRVNVEGTRHVLQFLEEIKHLQRFAHTSTVAVSGTHIGLFREDDLDVGQGFKNNYDETKFLSEQLVRERRGDFPTVIFRPTPVVGHSKTGAIEKIDGPYYGLTMIARNMHLVTLTAPNVKFHFGPVDFIADAMYAFFEDEDAVGKVFHLVDPNPMSFDAFIDLACERWGKIKPILRLPPKALMPFFKFSLFEKMTGVTREAFEYSLFPVEYDSTNTQAFGEKHGIRCPDVADYIDVMIQYFREHLHDPAVRKGDWKQGTT